MPPDAIHRQAFSVFLAGSIEMGKAVKWQSRMASLLQHLPISVYNPRRGHWDPKATPEAKNKDFRHQVEWELNALEEASVICFFFDHDTMSPVTMCELGLWAASGKVVVCCNKQFWKSGNIHIVCERYGIPLVQEFGELQPLIVAMLGQKKMMLDSNGDLTEDPKKQDRSKLLGVDVLVEAGYKIPKKANA
jgi:nucleoside 2-deoxyribosyltransferase